MHDELAGLAGVEAVAVGSDLPLRGSTSAGMLAVAASRRDAPTRYYRHRVLPDYFAALEVPILRGRPFQAGDREEAPRVAIVSRAGARRLWPGSPAVGQRISLEGPDGPWVEVVGVAGDVRYRDLTSDLGAAGSEPDVYLPFAQETDDDLEVAVRVAGDPAILVPAIRAAVARVDPQLPLLQVQTLAESLREQTALRRLGAALLGTFAVVGLALAAIGIYGVVAYTVGARWREIALRMALGGQARSVVALVVRQGMTLVVVGTAAGLLGSFAMSESLSRLVFGVGARDPLTYALVPLLLVTVALLASVGPAWRAARLEPQAVLRGD
jgi:predicted permease